MKTCSKCRRRKQAREFYTSSSSPDGLCGYCSDCAKRHAAAWRKANPERARAGVLAWQKKYPERYRESKRKSAYGLDNRAFERILTSQKHCCAICRRKLKTRCIDHDHKTQLVRGVLCRPCNTGLGIFKDSVVGLMAAVKYLEKHLKKPLAKLEKYRKIQRQAQYSRSLANKKHKNQQTKRKVNSESVL